MINLFCRYFPPPSEGGGHVFFKNLILKFEESINLYTHQEAIDLNKKNIKIGLTESLLVSDENQIVKS